MTPLLAPTFTSPLHLWLLETPLRPTLDTSLGCFFFNYYDDSFTRFFSLSICCSSPLILSHSIYTQMHTLVHTHTHPHPHAHAYTRTHTRTHARMHARTNARTHARTHAHTLWWRIDFMSLSLTTFWYLPVLRRSRTIRWRTRCWIRLIQQWSQLLRLL